MSKGKKKIPGIGKGIGAAIDAFLIRQHDKAVEEGKQGAAGGGTGGAGGEEGAAAVGSSAAAAAGKGEEMHST